MQVAGGDRAGGEMGFPGGGEQPTGEQRAALEVLVARLGGGKIDLAQFREQVRAIFDAAR